MINLTGLAENVRTTGANEGKAFAVVSEMKQAGYNIVAHKYKFEEYGVPQARHRVVIVGIKNNLNVTFDIPAPLKIKISVGEALKDIPVEASHQELTRQSKM